MMWSKPLGVARSPRIHTGSGGFDELGFGGSGGFGDTNTHTPQFSCSS